MSIGSDQSDNWQVVGDPFCKVTLVGAIEPEIKVPHSAFLMTINAVVRRLRDDATVNGEDSDVPLFLDEDNWTADEKEVTILVQHDNMVSAVYQALSVLQVPSDAHLSSTVDQILYQTGQAERKYYFYTFCPAPKLFQMAVQNYFYTFCPDPKLFQMAVQIDVYAADRTIDYV